MTLSLSSRIRVAVKFPLIAAVIATYLVFCLLGTLLIWNRVLLQKFQNRMISVASIAASRVMNIKVKIQEGSDYVTRKSSPHFLVCNHLSYTDVLILAALWPSAFVTSVEVQMSGLLGVITKLGGCLFVERRSRERLEQEKREIADTIKKGISVFVFPEATSSGGDGVLKFKTALFDCALLANVPIQPITLYYSRINGEIPNRSLKDHVCYYGDMSFLPSLIRVLSLKSFEATLIFHPPIEPPIALDRKELAMQTHALISETYGKLVSCESIPGNDARSVSGSLAEWKSAN